VLGTGVQVDGPATAFDAHAREVHAFLWRRAGPEDADDLLGEVFAVVARRWSTYDPAPGPVLPWLYGIAARELSAARRSTSRRALLVAALAGRSPAYDDDPWPDADARLDAARLRDPLARALLALPDDEREVLLLVAWEHLSPTEAASALGIPAGTARSRLHRARRALQPVLEGHR